VSESLHFARTVLSIYTVFTFIKTNDRYFFEHYKSTGLYNDVDCFSMGYELNSLT